MIYSPTDLNKFSQLLEGASHVVIMQAEHIDADSLGSSLGLESALGALGKQTTLFCIDEVPNYLKHLEGWDRITNELPNDYDLAILVDSSTVNQLERTWSKYKQTILNRPLVCIDHHLSTTAQLEGENILLLLDGGAGASGQQVTELIQHYDWKIDSAAAYALASAIKADTVNLSTKFTTPETFRCMAYLLEQGADVELLRENIEKTNNIPADQLPLRATVLGRTQFFQQNRIAITYFTASEYKQIESDKLLIERTKHDLRNITEVLISVVITERSGYSNASMRANIDVARLVAEHFGGGGHDRAASCRFENQDHSGVIAEIVPVIEGFIDAAL